MSALYDFCIVGAGPAGATLARLLAEAGHRCLIIEKRGQVGGNLHDHYNRYGILIHSYGPHFFRTDKDHIWNWLSNFTEWHYYQHKVLANVCGMLVPFPVNLDTYNLLTNSSLNQSEFAELLKSFHRYDRPRNAEEAIINQIGEELYELFVKHYTIKQWGHNPKELDPETVRRIRVRTNRESRYQPLKYQALPLEGYTTLIGRIIDHPRIQLLLYCDYKEVIDQLNYGHLIYTAALDYYFDRALGALEYRSLYLEEKTFFQESYQEAAVINYPNNYAFTRITEYKKLTGQKHHYTTVHFEYPRPYIEGQNSPYYPILNEQNLKLKQGYIERAAELKQVTFFGRLAEYKYYAMDEIFDAAFQIARSKFSV